ncbi:MAG: Uma2 family endonuclease [Cyanobacteriota bacterium]|nr:Uma2 family endonuclease [Cyanobacteriota bacterium]
MDGQKRSLFTFPNYAIIKQSQGQQLLTMTTSATISKTQAIFSLEEWMEHPPERREWVDGKLLEKNGITGKHGRTQARLATYWINYKYSSSQGGEVYISAPCRTVGRGRCPDVGYLTPELVAQYGDFNVLPQSFSLIAEIISPTDAAEDAFTKVNEYLASGCEEVWLILPESEWMAVITGGARLLFTKGETACTQIILPGFSVAVDDLLS